MKALYRSTFAIVILLLAVVYDTTGQTYPKGSKTTYYLNGNGTSLQLNPTFSETVGNCASGNSENYQYYVEGTSSMRASVNSVNPNFAWNYGPTLRYRYKQTSYTSGCGYTGETWSDYPDNSTVTIRINEVSMDPMTQIKLAHGPLVGQVYDLYSYVSWVGPALQITLAYNAGFPIAAFTSGRYLDTRGMTFSDLSKLSQIQYTISGSDNGGTAPMLNIAPTKYESPMPSDSFFNLPTQVCVGSAQFKVDINYCLDYTFSTLRMSQNSPATYGYFTKMISGPDNSVLSAIIPASQCKPFGPNREDYFNPKTVGTYVLEVTYRNADLTSGVSYSIQKTIEVVDPASLTLSTLPTLCPGSTANLNSYISRTGGTWSGANISGSTFTAANSGNTVQSYVATYTYAGCTKNFNINVQPNPQSTFANTATICYTNTGTSVVLEDLFSASKLNGDTYSWNCTNNATVNTKINTVTGQEHALVFDGSFGSASSTTTLNFTITLTSVIGCSKTTNASLDVRPLPANPSISVTESKRCGTGTVPFSITVPSGVTFQFYTAATGGSNVGSLGATGTWTSPSITQNTGGTISVNYYVEAVTNSTGCKSASRTAITATVEDFTPYIGSPISVCSSESFNITDNVAGIFPAGGTWTSAPAGAISVIGGKVMFNNAKNLSPNTYTLTYTVTQGVCTKAPTVVYTVKPNPSAVTNTSPSICYAETGTIDLNTVFGLTLAGGEVVEWSSADGVLGPKLLSGGKRYVSMDGTVGSPSFDTPFSVTVKVTTSGGCIATNNYNFTVKRVPVAPLVNDVSRCGNGTVSLAVDSPVGGNTYDWFSVPTGGSKITTATSYTTPSLSATATYYIASVYNGCSSLTRETAQAIVNPVPTAPTFASSPLIICTGAGNYDLSVSNNNSNYTYRWYTVASGGTAITGIPGNGSTYNVALVLGSKNYYVESVSDKGCISSRTPLTVTTGFTPATPVADNLLSCNGAAVSGIFLIKNPEAGVTYNWYASVSSPTILSGGANVNQLSVVNVSNTTSYWIESVHTNSGCTIARKEVKAIVVSAPPTTPGADSPINLCSGPGPVSLSVTSPNSGLVYKWYDVASLGTALATGDAVTLTVASLGNFDYYVEAVSAEGCASSRKNVKVAVTNSLATPQLDNVLDCDGPGGAVLSVKNAGTSGTYYWYNAASAGSIIASGTQYIPSVGSPGTYKYWVAAEDGACKTSRTEVTLNTSSTPAVPVVANKLLCAGGGSVTLTVSNANANDTYKWYNALVAGTELTVGITYNPSLTATSSFYVSATSPQGCASERKKVDVTVSAPPADPAVDDKSRCGSGLVTLDVKTPLPGFTYNWYSDANKFTLLKSDAKFEPTVSLSRSYYVESKNADNCLSNLMEVRVTVNQLPSAPTINSSVVCQAGSDAILTATTSMTNVAYKWYDATKNLIVAETTPSLKATNVITDLTYFGSIVDVATGCESALTQGDLQVFPDVKFGDDLFFCTTTTGNVNLALAATPAGGTFAGPGVTGSIFNGQNLTYNNTYPITYTFTKGGCSKTVTKKITLGLDVKVAVDKPEVNVGEMVKFTPSVNGTFEWDFGDTWTSSELAPAHYYYKPGVKDIKLKVTTSNCSGTFNFPALVKVNGFDVVTGLEPVFNRGIGIINPVVEHLIVFTETDMAATIAISDISGKEVQTQPVMLSRGRNEVPLQHAPMGFYIVNVTNGANIASFRVLRK